MRLVTGLMDRLLGCMGQVLWYRRKGRSKVGSGGLRLLLTRSWVEQENVVALPYGMFQNMESLVTVATYPFSPLLLFSVILLSSSSIAKLSIALHPPN